MARTDAERRLSLSRSRAVEFGRSVGCGWLRTVWRSTYVVEFKASYVPANESKRRRHEEGGRRQAVLSRPTEAIRGGPIEERRRLPTAARFGRRHRAQRSLQRSNRPLQIQRKAEGVQVRMQGIQHAARSLALLQNRKGVDQSDRRALAHSDSNRIRTHRSETCETGQAAGRGELWASVARSINAGRTKRERGIGRGEDLDGRQLGKGPERVPSRNVVMVKGVSFGASATREPQLQLLLEYCNAGSLDKLLEEDKLTDEGKAHAMYDAAKGMQYLHEREIIHRDIASRNCLVNKGPTRTVVKIADFGLSRLAPDHYELATKRRLPVFSMHPESLVAREWTRASDVWSFGILILEMYNKGRNPYEQYFNKNNMDLRKVTKFLQEGKRVDPPRGMPPDLAEIAAQCMKKLSERPQMDAVADMLKKYCAKFH